VYPEVLSVTVHDIASLAVCTGQAPLVSQMKVYWQWLSASPPDTKRGPRWEQRWRRGERERERKGKEGEVGGERERRGREDRGKQIERADGEAREREVKGEERRDGI